MTRQRIDRYEVKREIGRGGMATVYYAYDPRVKRDVAIKLLLVQLTADPRCASASTVRPRSSPHWTTRRHPVYDYGEDQGQPYIVMRYMAGGSLEGRLQKRGGLPLGDAARIVERIAAALDQAHAQGLVHRDLKPGNILFDQYGDAYLSDFGIAHIAATGSMARRRAKSKGGTKLAALTGGGLLGTPSFISPEQVVGAQVDARSDVYSLAVLLYTMLVGKPPFEADTPTAVALKHISDPVPDIRKVRSKLPPDIQPILERSMAKEREDRHPGRRPG
jgi:serine/threonine-protein kinase